MKLALGIAGGVAALIIVALIGINLLISADAVRDRVAARVKEQTGRELIVKGSTSLMLAAQSAYRHHRRFDQRSIRPEWRSRSFH